MGAPARPPDPAGPPPREPALSATRRDDRPTGGQPGERTDGPAERAGVTGRRPDVQGLRAVAVLTVVAAHAGVGPLAGGYVGVDVFLVVSGFLITGLLAREVATTGKVSLPAFWARRARRILPAATAVALVTLLVSMAVLSLQQAREVLTDAVWATFFAANVRSATAGVDYFALDQGPSPLQHYWSLAVEEQFYLVWPPLLLAIVLLARRQAAGRAAGQAAGQPPVRSLVRGRTVLAAVGGLTALSLGWSVWASTTSPETAYFSTPARAWELGVGALAALAGPRLVRPLTPRARGLLAALGLAMVAHACLTFTEATAVPGPPALLPVAGTALLLLAGLDLRPDRRVPAVLRALGARPLRAVGDRSYSLYLWHWPALVLVEAQTGPRTAWTTALALVLAAGLTIVTHRFVEEPFRTARTWTVPRGLMLYPACLSLVVAGASAGTTWTQWASGETGDAPAITLADAGAAERTGSTRSADREAESADALATALVRASVQAARRDQATPSDLSPDLLAVREDVAPVACDYGDDGLRDLCTQGDPGAERSVVVLGDSHARMWLPALERVAGDAGHRLHALVKVQCTAADVTVAAVGTGQPWAACDDFRAWALDQVEELRPDVVVVTSTSAGQGVFDRAGGRVTDEAARAAELEAGWRRTLDRLVAAAGRVVVLRDVPRAPADPAACLGDGRPSLQRCAFTPDAADERLAEVASSAARATGAEVLDPSRWFCWDGTCPAVVGSTITYRDAGHVTATYAADLTAALGEALALARP